MEKPHKDKKSPNNPFDLPEDRLASTTETGKRVYIYPAEVSGSFRRLRNFANTGLILLFLVLPWLSIGGKPILLLDIFHRKFVILGQTFWAHDAPLLFLVFFSFILTIGFVTTLFGRFWCGAMCPQTIFVDHIYRRIEDWIEGSPAQKRRLDKAPWSASKLFKRGVKWGLYLVISLIITHSFLAYFVGPQEVALMVRQSPAEHPLSFLVILITTGIILFDFGWFREQFCIIACPYGRLQSVLMDDHSLTVAYDQKRGEPRKQDRNDTSATGDCINCYRCVQVCPTGIDIRRGVQMECIMCTACIDACDTVMTKLNKPKGLIRLDSEAGVQGRPRKWLRPRVFIYLGLLLVAQILLVVSLREHSPITHHVLRASQPYRMIQDEQVVNQFTVTLRNQSSSASVISLGLPDTLVSQGVQLIVPEGEVRVMPGEVKHLVLFVQFPKALLVDGKAELQFVRRYSLGDADPIETQEVLTVVGPLL